MLTGRADDLELIREFVDRARLSGGALLLSGDAGVGKTELLDAAAVHAHAANTRVARAAGVEFESAVGYAGLHQTLHPLLDGLHALHTPYRSALSVALGLEHGAPPHHLMVSNAVSALLAQAGTRRPLLLIVDDLPRLDRASALVMGLVARRLRAGTGADADSGGAAGPGTGTGRVGFLGAYRSDEGGFFDGGGITTHHLRPLDPAAAEELVKDRFPTLTPRVRTRLLSEAQGNPLALLELPIALTGTRRTTTAIPEVLPLGRRLQTLFAARIEALPPTTRLLLLCAVLDGTGDLHTLQAAATHIGAGPAGIEELAHAERAGLVHVDDTTGRLTFRHPLTRSAVVELSTSDQRRRTHRALADHTADRPERHAWHLAQATVEPDEHVATLLEQTAHAVLRRGDADGAIAALLRAADLSRGRQRSRRISEAAYLGADLTGDLRDVPRLLEDARRADGGRAGPLAAAVAAAHHLLLSGEGDLDTAHRLLTGAIDMQHQPYDATDTTMIDALHTLAWVCHGAQRPELWKPLDRATALLTPHIPDRLALTLATIADPARTAPAALALLDETIATLDRETDPVHIIRTAMAAMYADRLADCRTALRRVLRDGRDTSAITLELQGLVFLSRDCFAAGDWDQLDEHTEQGRRLSATHNYQLLTTDYTYQRALVAAARGDTAATRALTDEMTLWAAPRRVGFALSGASHAKTLAALGQGRYEEAYRHASAVSPAGELAPHVPTALFLVMDLVEAAVRTGRHGEAAAHATAAHEAGIAAISPRLRMIVEASAALTTPEPHAREHFRRALSTPTADRWPFDHARVRLAYGEHLRRTRATTEARTHLTDALDTFQRLGARPWAARAATELRATGEPAAHTHNAGTASLTPQQREIAHLAAAGLTNKQIGERLHLSPRTVSTHLHQLFPKLGITSRAALRDALATPTHHTPDDNATVKP
ncbi:LuxR C-terminal-related transcriptional regulator [Streptomyces sp. NPDC051582]|uniref:LuxR C-terminal-related transcriptional regulator n=1 Tax=Streptomyces sp. NPDC051582 TaxID=3155167 RepID=UPI00341CF148